jgi:hypothetical protein
LGTKGDPLADSFFRENPRVDEHILMDQLEELLERFGVQIRYEAMKQDEDSVHVAGGLCLLRGEYVLIVNSNAKIRDKIRILGMALKQFDYDQIYIRPVLREFLERIPDQSRLNERYIQEAKD